ncbi:MAG: LuxR C-terminal-related transcriptional regulator [Nitrospira sp.]
MGTSRRSSSAPRVGQGLSTKDIAYTLSISDRTVRHHVTSIFDKGSVPKRQKLLIRVHHVCSTPVYVYAPGEAVSKLKDGIRREDAEGNSN